MIAVRVITGQPQSDWIPPCDTRNATPKAISWLWVHMPTTITVEGMSCAGCEQSVEDALRGVSGVTDVDADRDSEQATVEGNAAVDDLVSAVEDAGYSATA